MNVLIIPSWYPNGQSDIVGSFFREQSIALSKHGNQVYVLNGTYTQYQNMFSELCRRVCFQEDNGIHVVRQLIPTFGFSRFPGLYIKLFEIRIRKLLKKLLQQMPKLQFDVIHAHSCYPAGVVANILGKELGLPVIITEHRSNYISGHILDKQIPVISKAVNGCNAFICVSRSLKDSIEEVVGNDDHIIVLPNIVSDIFYPSARRDNSHESVTFVSVGGLIHSKRHLQLVRCFYEAFWDQPNVRLRIAGEGEERQPIEQFIHDHHFEKQAFLLGQLPRKEIAEELNNAQVFVLTSAYETFGVVYAEALSCGLPVIAAKNGGANDIVNQKNGVLVDVDNDEELIKALRFMKESYRRFDRDAIALDAKERFSEGKVISQICKLYDKVISDSKRK